MKTILCYGDSNTWGYQPGTGQRYTRDIRWTGVLQKQLGADYYIIEEGLNGRTTVHDDPLEPGRNGLTYLMPCLLSHRPIDLVVLMLGTNDLKTRFSLPAMDIAKGIETIVTTILQSQAGLEERSPELLLLTPPPIGKLTEFKDRFLQGKDKSLLFSTLFKEVSKQFKCSFLDTGKIIASSDIDGIHLDRDSHLKLGLEIAKAVRAIFSREE
jgi:lysophospholipase L1-like esterase